MSKKWRYALPAVGLLLLALITAESFHANETDFHFKRAFYWSSLRLDRDPLDRHHLDHPRTSENGSGAHWDPETAWIDPGPAQQIFLWFSLPALAGSAVVVALLARTGVNELWTFLVVAPALTAAWFYIVGWFLDRRFRHRPASASGG